MVLVNFGSAFTRTTVHDVAETSHTRRGLWPIVRVAGHTYRLSNNNQIRR